MAGAVAVAVAVEVEVEVAIVYAVRRVVDMWRKKEEEGKGWEGMDGWMDGWVVDDG